MITSKQLGNNGRIGNQLFQIAATIGLAEKHNDTAVFSTWSYSRFFKNPINQSLTGEKTTEYREPHFHYSEIGYKQNLDLIGYFQSEKYWENCKESIRHYFEPSDEIITKLKSKYADALSLNICSVHVRRGDYVGSKVHDVCTMDYYNRAMKYVNSSVFAVFSDDIEWCKSNFKGNCIFIEGNSDIEDLFLMSLCKNNIIANSSFSWWAAYLNKNPNKTVIAPSKWFADNERDEKDLIPREWIRDLNYPKKTQNIGLLIIATGRYDKFVMPLIESARKHFCTNHNVTYFVFTDSVNIKGKDIVTIAHKHEPFPLPTLLRYKTFSDNADKLKDMDYLFYCDADMLFVDEVGDEILSDLVATDHPGYGGTRGTPEERPESTAYVSRDTKMTYFCGGFNGGSREQYLKMAATISRNTQIDAYNGIIAIWHDESHINRYFIDNKPTTILDSSYCYGEDMNLPYKKRLVALTKEQSYVTEKKQEEKTVHERLKEIYKPKCAVIFYHKNISSIYKSEWIKQCVDSIKNQTYKDFDVFELNYGGDDTRYAHELGVNNFFISEKMDNHIIAMNYLISAVFSKGYDILFNTNMDDWFSSDRFEKQVHQIQKGYQLISSNFYHISTEGSVIRDMNMVSYGNIKYNLDKNHNIIAHPVVAVHKSFWDEDLHYNILLGYEDLELWQRAKQKGKKFKILEDYLLYYRIHPAQVGKKDQVLPRMTPAKPVTEQSVLDDFAESLYHDFTNSIKYNRSGFVEMSEVIRHLKNCPSEYEYQHIIDGNDIQIKIKSGEKTATTQKMKFA